MTPVRRQPADRHPVRLGARRLLGRSRTARRTARTWAGPTCPGRASTPTARRASATASAARPGSLVRIGPDGKTLAEVPAALPTAEDPSGAQHCRRCRWRAAPTRTASRSREDLEPDDHHATTPSRRTSSIDPVKPANAQPVPRHRAHLGHQRPQQPEGRVGLGDARRPAPGAQPRPRGAARDHGGHGHQPAEAQGRVRVVDVRRRHLLHAGHHRRRSPCGARCSTTRRAAEGRPARASPRAPAATAAAGCRPAPTTGSCTTRSSAAAPARSTRTTRACRRWSTSSTSRSCSAPGNDPQCNIDTIARGLRRRRRGRLPDGGRRARRCRDGTSAAGRTGARSTTSTRRRGRHATARRRRPSRIAVSQLLRRPLRRRRQPQGVHGRRRPQRASSTLDTTFRDENQGTPCVDFNRTDWPHGERRRRQAALAAVRRHRCRTPLARRGGRVAVLAALLTRARAGRPGARGRARGSGGRCWSSPWSPGSLVAGGATVALARRRAAVGPSGGRRRAAGHLAGAGLWAGAALPSPAGPAAGGRRGRARRRRRGRRLRQRAGQRARRRRPRLAVRPAAAAKGVASSRCWRSARSSCRRPRLVRARGARARRRRRAGRSARRRLGGRDLPDGLATPPTATRARRAGRRRPAAAPGHTRRGRRARRRPLSARPGRLAPDAASCRRRPTAVRVDGRAVRAAGGGAARRRRRRRRRAPGPHLGAVLWPAGPQRPRRRRRPRRPTWRRPARAACPARRRPRRRRPARTARSRAALGLPAVDVRSGALPDADLVYVATSWGGADAALELVRDANPVGGAVLLPWLVGARTADAARAGGRAAAGRRAARRAGAAGLPQRPAAAARRAAVAGRARRLGRPGGAARSGPRAPAGVLPAALDTRPRRSPRAAAVGRVRRPDRRPLPVSRRSAVRRRTRCSLAPSPSSPSAPPPSSATAPGPARSPSRTTGAATSRSRTCCRPRPRRRSGRGPAPRPAPAATHVGRRPRRHRWPHRLRGRVPPARSSRRSAAPVARPRRPRRCRPPRSDTRSPARTGSREGRGARDVRAGVGLQQDDSRRQQLDGAPAADGRPCVVDHRWYPGPAGPARRAAHLPLRRRGRDSSTSRRP